MIENIRYETNIYLLLVQGDFNKIAGKVGKNQNLGRICVGERSGEKVSFAKINILVNFNENLRILQTIEETSNLYLF